MSNKLAALSNGLLCSGEQQVYNPCLGTSSVLQQQEPYVSQEKEHHAEHPTCVRKPKTKICCGSLTLYIFANFSWISACITGPPSA